MTPITGEVSQPSHKQYFSLRCHPEKGLKMQSTSLLGTFQPFQGAVLCARPFLKSESGELKAPRGTYMEGERGDEHLSEWDHLPIYVLTNVSKDAAFLLTGS